jgi:type IV secretory pathway TrbL component
MTTRGNLKSGERAVSAVFGVALAMLAARRGGPILRTLAGVAGASLLARSLAGHCAMKAALNGESSLLDGVADQWRHTRVVASNLRNAAERMRAASGRGELDSGSEVTEARRAGSGQTATQAANAAASTY